VKPIISELLGIRSRFIPYIIRPYDVAVATAGPVRPEMGGGRGPVVPSRRQLQRRQASRQLGGGRGVALPLSPASESPRLALSYKGIRRAFLGVLDRQYPNRAHHAG
jgi:hypothetical protein